MDNLIYILNGEEEEVRRDREQEFLEDNKDSNPVLKSTLEELGFNTAKPEDGVLAKEILAGNQVDSAESADEESNSSTEINQSQDNQQADTESNSVDTSSDLLTVDDIQADLFGLSVAPDYINPIGDALSRGQKEIDQIMLNADKAADTSIDSNNDGITDSAEVANKSVDTFYEDNLYNELDAPALQEQIDAEFNEDAMFNITSGNINKDGIYIPPQKEPENASKKIDSTIQNKYDSIIQNIAFDDWMDAQEKEVGLNFQKLTPEQKQEKKLEIMQKESFKRIHNQLKDDALRVRQERATLKRKLKSGEITPIQYDEQIRILNGYKDIDGNDIAGKDAFHNKLIQSIEYDNAQKIITDSIKDQLNTGKHSDNKKHKKYLQLVGEITTEQNKLKTEKLTSDIVKLGETFDDTIILRDNEGDWLESDEANKIVTRLEEINKIEHEGDQSLLDEIKRISTSKIEADAWINEEVEKIKNTEYTTQEGVDAANARLAELNVVYKRQIEAKIKDAESRMKDLEDLYNSQIQESVSAAELEFKQLQDIYKVHVDNYNLHSKSLSNQSLTFKNLDEELTALNLSSDNLSKFMPEVYKMRKANNIANAVFGLVTMGKDILEFANAIDETLPYHKSKHSRFTGRGAGERFAHQATIDMISKNTDLVSDDGEIATTMHDALGIIKTDAGHHESDFRKTMDKFDKWKYDKIDKYIMDAPTHQEAWGTDGNEFDLATWWDATSAMAVQQIPIFTALAMGPMGWAAIASSSGGSKYVQLQKEVELNRITNGIYGQEYTQGQMFMNSLVHGTAELAFEYVTFKILGVTLKSLGVGKASKTQLVNSFKKNVQQNVFNWRNTGKNMLNVGSEWLQEGASESMTSITQNLSDIMILGKDDVGVFDNAGAAFINGVTLAGFLQSPRLIPLAVSPFVTLDANQKIGKVDEALKKVGNKIAALKLTGNPRYRDQIKNLEERHAELLNERTNILETSIHRVDLLSPKEKKVLLDIEKKNLKDRKEADNVDQDTNLDKKERERRLKEINKRVDARQKAKNEILDKITPNRATRNYKKQMAWMKAQAAILAKAGGLKLSILEVNDTKFQDMYRESKLKDSRQSQVDNLAMYYEAVESQVEEAGGKETEIQEQDGSSTSFSNQVNAAERIINSKGNYGIMQPQFDANNKLVGLNIVINRTAAFKDGQWSTGSHEFIHAAFFNTLKADPIMREKLDKELNKIISGKGFKVLNARLLAAKLAANKGGEEKLAVIAELMIEGDIVIEETGFKKLAGIFRRFTQNTFGKAIKFNNTQDIKNFLIDYHKNVTTGTKNKAFTELINKGAGGRMFRDAKFKQEIADNSSHSKNISDNLDWKEDFDQHTLESTEDPSGEKNPKTKKVYINLNLDENGKFIKKYPNEKDLDGKDIPGTGKENFRNSQDIQNAAEEIMNSEGLSNLIKQGMIAETGMTLQELNTFVDEVKMNLYMRFVGGLSKKAQDQIKELEAKYKSKEIKFDEFIEKKEKLEKEGRRKGFDPAAANGSLFGWLTGGSGARKNATYWRARGDVMNAYIKEGGGRTTSMNRQVGTDGGTIEDIIPGETDQRIQNIDEMDMTPSRKRDAKQMVVELVKLKQAIGLSNNASNVITETIQDVEMGFDGVTYKGVKRLLDSAIQFQKKDKNGNLMFNKKGEPIMKTPTTEKKITPTGALFELLNAVSSEVGIDPLRIIAGQDLDATQRVLAQNWLFEKSVNEDGSFNRDILNIALPKGQTRSGEATGVANTKLGQFYVKGERLLSKDGADSKLGNKYRQTKRTDVTMEEFLGAFGLTPNGNKIPGKQFDGILRELVLAITQTVAVQEVKIDNIVNGTNTEAVVAKLSDGSSDLSFSKRLQNTFDSELQDILSDLSEMQLDLVNKESVYNYLKSKDLALSDSDLVTLSKQFTKWTQEYIGQVDPSNIPVEFQSSLPEFLLDKLNQENIDDSLHKMLSPQYTVDSNGNIAKNVKSLFTLDRIKGNRTAVVDFSSNALAPIKIVNGKNAGGLGWSKQKLLRYMFSYAQGMYSGMTKVGDGQFIKDKDGNLIEDPQWENELNNDGSIKRYGNKYKRYKKDHPFVKDGSKKVGDVILTDKNKPVPQDFRGQIFKSIGDLISVLDRIPELNMRDTNGNILSKKDIIKKYNVNTKVYAETSDAALKDKNWAGREAQAVEVREMLQDHTKWFVDKVKSKNSSLKYEDLTIFAKGLTSGMTTPIRKAANVRYLGVGVENVLSKQRGRKLEFEHMMPASFMAFDLIKHYVNDGKLPSNFWDGFNVAIIPKTMDTALTKSKLRDSMNVGWRRGMPTWMRYFNDQVFGKEGIVALKDMITNETIGEGFVVANNEFIKKQFEKQKNSQRTNRLKVSNMDSFSKKTNPEVKGASVFDFDETVGISKNVVIANKDGVTKKISSEQWPFVGDKLIEEGWEMDFTDFNKVTDGKPGPLFDKMKRQIEKFGPKNVFILTARGPGSQKAIHDWLKSNGINIPLKNVTGLGQSSGDAKAQWMLDKFEEGYNDMYFADDALPNVEAVKFVLSQLDIKSKVVQAGLKKIGKKTEGDSFSKRIEVDPNVDPIDKEFNDILEQVSNIEAGKVVSGADARAIGKGKNRFNFFVPPSAEDFKGLLYRFLPKGKDGEMAMSWFKENLLKPFAKAYVNWNTYKQNMSNEYTALKKAMPNVTSILKNIVPNTNFTNDSAVRVYLWSKAGFSIPGMDKATQAALAEHVMSNPDLLGFAEGLSKISRIEEGWSGPSKNWVVETIATDLANIVNSVGRQEFLAEWIQNKNIIFSEKNLNKIEAIYGSDFRYELEQMLFRMETGRNREQGQNKHVNALLDWINGSVGAVMFFNMRSAMLQTISAVNFLNFENNNIFAAAKAFANQPQFWKDFAFLLNSPMLKQRRAGLQIDVSASELTKAFAEGNNKPQAVIAYLLEIGFTPTKLADSFAIAMGGSTFYRNQLNFYLKQGMSNTEAQAKAFLDFQEIAEETQQSSRPDLISNQQAGPLGRLILAWQNTPMQMTRLTKKALSDLVNRRGDWRANVSRIIYYGVVQNLIFGALQTGLAFIMFGDDDEEIKKKEIMVLNGALDTLLRGTGIYGAMLSTLKNTYLEFRNQEKKGYGKRQDWKVLQQLISLSPPVGTKTRKIMAAYKTYQYNKGVGKQIGLRIENPTFDMATNLIEALTNAPVARLLHKINNLEEAITGNHELWQRMAIGMGWSMWSVGVRDEELEAAKDAAKVQRAIDKKKIKDAKNEIQKKEDAIKKEEENKEKEEENKKKGIKTVQCSGVNSSGKRCGLTEETSAKTWKCFHHSEFVDGSDRDGDGIKEYQCTGTTSSGKRCKNKGEYGKKKRCYAHQ